MSAVLKVAVAIVGVAIVAVLVSRNAQTSAVINSAGSALASVLKAATGPVSNSGLTGITG